MGASASNPGKPFFDSLPNELVVEILLRLPIKSAHRCMCVSKRWFSLLSDPYFGHQYKLRQPNSSLSTLLLQGIYSQDCRDLDLKIYSTSEEKLFKFQGFSFSFLREQSATGSIHILASCNDLVLCSDEFWYKSQYYYVCNPLTRQWVGFPWPSSVHEMVVVGLICDYCQCNDQGLAITTTRCKVVRIPKFDGTSTTFYVEIFSCETRQWSELHLSCPRGFAWTPSTAVVCNGMLHWLSCDNDKVNINGIVANDPFNNSTSQCHFIDLPKDTNFPIGTTFTGVCQGHLWISRKPIDYGFGHALRVWELKDFFTGEWCLKHSIHLNQAFDYDGFYIDWLVFDPSNGDGVYTRKQKDIILFKIKSKKLKLVSSRGKRRSSLQQLMAVPLVLPLWPTPVPMLQPDAVQY